MDPSSFFCGSKRVDASTRATAKCKNGMKILCNHGLKFGVPKNVRRLITDAMGRATEIMGMLAAPAHG
ncbi:uncharacterized protein (UPF0147 family) [Nitrobacteraceae bacterium AZCC 1564]